MSNGQHGGPRPNSGRPPKHGEPGIRTSVVLPADVRQFLLSLGDSYSDGVMHVVKRSREWREFKRNR